MAWAFKSAVPAAPGWQVDDDPVVAFLFGYDDVADAITGQVAVVVEGSVKVIQVGGGDKLRRVEGD